MESSQLPLCVPTVSPLCKNYSLIAKQIFARVQEISNLQATEVLSKHFKKQFHPRKVSEIMNAAGFLRFYRKAEVPPYSLLVWWRQR